jgi:hypothetical protein
MSSLAEVTARLATVEAIISGAVSVPKGFVDIDETKVADKTGWMVSGVGKPNINGGLRFTGISSVANPTEDAHFSKFTYLAFD